MNDFQIKCFLATVRHMNFSRASEELFIAQSAISRHIIQLESELEVQLFKRRGKIIQLTSEGKDYYYFFSEVAGKYDEIRQKHQFQRPGGKTLLKYSAFPVWYISDLLFENAALIKRKHPELEPAIKFCKVDNLLSDLQHGVIDILFHIDEVFANAPGIFTEKIVDIPSVILYSERHPLALKEKLSPSDFKNETFLYIINETLTEPCMNKIIGELYDHYGFFPRVQDVPDVDTLSFMLESAQGVALTDYWSRIRLNSRMKTFRMDFKESIVIAWSAANHNPMLDIFVSETKDFFETMVQ